MVDYYNGYFVLYNLRFCKRESLNNLIGQEYNNFIESFCVSFDLFLQIFGIGKFFEYFGMV